MDNVIKFFKDIKNDKRKLISLMLALCGILLIFISSSQKGDTGDTEGLTEYKERMEAELSELCSSVKGAGRCRVTVSFAEGERYEYKGSNVISSEPPRVLGVTVVCEGGGSVEVKRALSECMSALFDIGKNRISVLEMK